MNACDQQTLTGQLPYLRRYARILAGNQKSADTLVIATIETILLLGSPSTLSRPEIYRKFTTIWNGPPGDYVRSLRPHSSTPSGVERRLAALPSLARQAFLLSTIEGFQDNQITDILDIKPDALPGLKAKARAAIQAQVATDVLIIEDEMFIAADLEQIVTSLGHRVIGIERTHSDAVRTIQFEKPGLVLSDVQLADGSCGIDAVNEILGFYEVPVVFITAYPERLLTGLRPEPAFIMTKPFKGESVQAVISQALFFDTRASTRRMHAV